MLPDLTFILGGAASGKSDFAERLILATGANPVYVATAHAWDKEMEDRIARHRARREQCWRNIEAPRDLIPALETVVAGEAVLVDCATLWLSNQLMAHAHIDAEVTRLMAALAACPAPVIVVSNEVGHGIVPANAQARAFREAQGRLNQKLAAQADLAVLVTAGLPLALKGALPSGAVT